MTTETCPSEDGQTISVYVPMTFVKRGGRKLVIAPDFAQPAVIKRQRVDDTMVKALARAFRWRKMLETGKYATLEEIATSEKINSSYISRILRMTLLAPAIVEAILDGCQPARVTASLLLKPFSTKWSEQEQLFLDAKPPAEQAEALRKDEVEGL